MDSIGDIKRGELKSMLKGKKQNRIFETGDPVRLNTKLILGRAKTSHYTDKYVRFITESKGKTFHVVRLDRFPGGEIVGLLENDCHYFYTGDLIGLN